uniref:Lysophospholipid acyltransferase 1 (Trinotate prediction) n=1 Tax=Henneguya salminicola TaxID=69463 RepID=A0A6G3MIQ5_HENSL
MYYTTWKSAESACNLCYVGFGGILEDGTQDWTKCQNVNILGYEFSTNMKEAVDNWNITTNHWLRKVVYNRVPKQKVICTFLVSALWHGFFLHYYYFFIFTSLMIHIGRKVCFLTYYYFLFNLSRVVKFSVRTF